MVFKGRRQMVRLHTRIGLAYDIGPAGADFVFNFQAARTPQQRVVFEQLSIRPYTPRQETVDPATHNRILRLQAPGGRLAVDYQCTVDVRQHTQDPATVPEVPIAQLPSEVVTYLYPSRYCPSDSMGALAQSQFGHLPQGYSRVAAVVAWVQQQVRFQSNTSHSGTNALDTLRDRVGVCRDFAHLMIALCRAINIPARFTTGIDFGADPALGPPDFHAYVEVYLGHRWYIFDPSGTAIPLGFIRIGTGRDAADVSFATIFGAFISAPPVIENNPALGFELPQHVKWGVSTA
jgi:transglutaminase-like putative cysteine protease